ncbi:PfkB family carbohydrate kinase [Streptomyces sp. NPDC001617]
MRTTPRRFGSSRLARAARSRCCRDGQYRTWTGLDLHRADARSPCRRSRNGRPLAPALVVGEALVDIITSPDGSRRSHPGGSPANVALGLGRLDHPVRLATRLGDDTHGLLVRKHLEAGGVELSPRSVADTDTSTATAVLDNAGAANYSFDITWELSAVVEKALLDGPPVHVHTGSIATALSPGANQVLKTLHALRASATISYDPNLRPALLRSPEQERERVEQLVAISDVVKASEEDAFMAGLVSWLLHAGLLGGGPGAEAARAALHAATETDRLPSVLHEALARVALAAALTCAREGADSLTAAELV